VLADDPRVAAYESSRGRAEILYLPGVEEAWARKGFFIENHHQEEWRAAIGSGVADNDIEAKRRIIMFLTV